MHTNKTTFKQLVEVFWVSTRLGLTSFGGPTAHLSYFHEEYVRRRNWLDEKSYADLVALAQFLPGPASSQVGIGIGVIRAGLLGGIVSFIGFTLPSVLVLIAFALLVQNVSVADAGWLHGLKIVAVAIVAHALLGMAKSLTPDVKRKAIALGTLLIALLIPSTFTQIGLILVAALVGFFLFAHHPQPVKRPMTIAISKTLSFTCLGLFFFLLVALPFLREWTGSYWVALFDHFYRAGALVFGGGHVVLPLLEQALIPTGWISKETFLAGYGATQAVPGPLFTFAAYLGTAMNGWQGGLFTTFAIFLPAFLLLLGALPFWNDLRTNSTLQGAVMGVNAAVVGILFATFYTPIWTSAIVKTTDFALAALLYSLLSYWKLPPWFIVLLGMLGGIGLQTFSS